MRLVKPTNKKSGLEGDVEPSMQTLNALRELSTVVQKLLVDRERELRQATLYHLGDCSEFLEARPPRERTLNNGRVLGSRGSVNRRKYRSLR